MRYKPFIIIITVILDAKTDTVLSSYIVNIMTNIMTNIKHFNSLIHRQGAAKHQKHEANGSTKRQADQG